MTLPTRILVPLAALAMPTIAWLSQRRVFGPDNGTVSNQYPTLLVAAGYAFSIWGLIFSLDLLLAVWQARRRPVDVLAGVRLPIAIGFALTGLWMIVFSQQMFWVALAVIWAALACVLHAALEVARRRPGGRAFWCALVPLSLHAGWLSLAVFLDTAQVVVAFHLLPTDRMLPWSIVLWAAAAALVLEANRRLGGSVAYAAPAVWGLAGVYVEQSRSALVGAAVSGWIALGFACIVVAQTILLRRRRVQAASTRDALAPR